MSENVRLTAKQARFVAALMAAATVSDAAAAAAISPRTARRYMRCEAVRAALAEAQAQLWATAARQAAAAMTEALSTLQTIMGDPNTPATSRVSAAKAVLDAAARLAEVVNLAERVAALEAATFEAERG